MAEVARVELWSEVAAGFGKRRAVLGHLLALTETVNLQGEHLVTVEIPFDDPAVVTLDTPAGETNVQGGRVLRLVKTNGAWSEHRIIESGTVNAPGQVLRRLVAQSAFLDLALRGIITRYLGQGKRTTTFPMLGLTAIEHWNQFIYPALVEGGSSWWTLDLEVVASVANQAVDLVYENDTPLSALRKLADALGKQELGFTATDEAYTVIIQRQVGESAATLVARARRNLVSLSYSESQTDQATRIFPVGQDHEAGRATMGEAEWRLTGALPTRAPHPLVGGQELITVRVLDEAGGPGPVQFDGQWAADLSGTLPVYQYRLVWATAAVAFLIYATDPATQSISLVGGIGQQIPHHDWHRVKIMRITGPAAELAYEEATFAEHPAMREAWGVLVGHVEVPNVPPTTNLIPNPLMRQWEASAALPTGWQLLPEFPGTIQVSRATAPGEWDTAGQALRAVMTSPFDRIASPVTVVAYGAAGFVSHFVRLKVLAGAARVTATLVPVIIATDGTMSFGGSGQVFPGIDDPLVRTTAINVWQDIGVAAAFDLLGPDLIALPNSVFVVHLIVLPLDATGCDVLIDSAQVTNTSDQRPLLEGNAGVRLFQAANERLARYATPAITIAANLLDLSTFDAVRFPYDEFILGGGVRVVDPATGVDVLTRITGWNRDWLHQMNTRLDISSARADLTATMARQIATVRR